MKYNWEVASVALTQLEQHLEAASAKGWEVFSVLAVEGAFVIIVRRPV
jgi:hypothetical protein